MADDTRGAGKDDDERGPRLSLRCTRCRFVIVVGTAKAAHALGWIYVDSAAGTGLCRACRAETES